MAAKSKIEEIAAACGSDPVVMVQAAYIRLGRQKEVAEHFGVTPSTLRYFLMANGLQERTVVTKSGGDDLIKLTRKGREAVKS